MKTVPLLLAGVLAAVLPGCGRQPTDALSWRESWELLVLTRDGGVVDARVTVGNSGLLRAQGHLRADRWNEEELPILYGRDVAPVEVSVDPQRRAVRLGYDGLARGEDPMAPETWTFRARDEEARLLLHLSPEAPLEVAPATGLEPGGQWTVAAPVARGQVTGWVSAAERGGLVEGWGALLHRGGDGRPAGRRLTVLIASRDLGLGLDLQGHGQLAWAWLEGEQLPLSTATVDLAETGPIVVRFADGPEVEIRTSRKAAGRRLLYEHLLGPEQRVLAWIGQWKERRVRRGWARVRWQGRELVGAAVVIEVDQAEWTGPVQRAEVGTAVGPEAVEPGAVEPGAAPPDLAPPGAPPLVPP